MVAPSGRYTKTDDGANRLATIESSKLPRSFEQAQSASVRRPHPFGLCTVIRHENHTKQHERRVVSWLVGGNVERWNTTLRGRSRRIGVESSIPVGCPDWRGCEHRRGGGQRAAGPPSARCEVRRRAMRITHHVCRAAEWWLCCAKRERGGLGGENSRSIDAA